ncbi:MAG: Stk1 family PASTA domain-containing Ser/Thr kinase [Thermincola sp.]|nr:Stk1 family PASTA domain-containing Ser/Thr kinase [Thermincola sp.]MDT3703992.1 Stk1 family PASTA domain-containing Ser/Thr kinase [Thermincola sp.]
MIGSLLGNRYEIISQLGGGGMALVYKARDTLLNRPVTVKVLRPEYTGDEEFVARFRREAQAVAKLSHPNIVSVYDVGQERDTHYIVMEYIEGRNLKQIIKENGKLPVHQAIDIASQICIGLQDAHEHGIVHRDIKPHNILVTDNGRVKVTDFGIAQMISSVTVTDSGTIVGSVHYFSPEQAKGGVTGAKSDIYSAGVVLYEMVTGKVPFEGETPIAVALKHIQESPLPPSKINAQVSPELERVILRAMEKDVTMRYMSAGDMARDLRRLTTGGGPDDTRVMDADEFATRVLSGPVIITKDMPFDEENEYRKRKKKKMRPMAKVFLVAVVLGLLAGAVYGAFLGLNSYLNVPDVRVPDVKNKPLEEAKIILEKNQLDYNPQLRNDPTVPNGNVISQDPFAGSTVKQNTKIVLIVSNGPKYVQVPNVVKKEKAAAEVDIGNAGFDVSHSEEFSNEVPAGSVISQTPSGGSDAVEGSTVKLVISKGAEPKPTTVPNLVGLTREAAEAALKDAGLVLNPQAAEKESTDFPQGLVISQNPAADVQLNQGDTVSIVLSAGPGPKAKMVQVDVPIPDDGMIHTVKIVVTDVTGTRVALGPEEHNSGERFTTLINYYNKGKIQVYLDEKLVREELVN